MLNPTQPAKTSEATGRWAIAAPLAHPQFRHIWLASLLSNFGLLIQGVGAAWAMTSLANSITLVALVQTALMLPVMLLSVIAGALADMYDRRKVALTALCVSISAATGLTILTLFELVTPAILLAGCFTAGIGMALFGPAWQASVAEQVPTEALPSAVALNGISFNLARSFGPAIGGLIVAAGGAVTAFGANALCCLPMLVVLYRWRRLIEPTRLPPERLGRAIISGLRYALHSPMVRVVLLRAIIPGLAGGSVLALMPVIARDLLQGDARLYGLLLGLFGIGAVTGAILLEGVRKRYADDRIIHWASAAMGVSIAVAGISRIATMTAIAVFVAGVAWITMVTIFNVVIQLSVPRWVAGRALAFYQATMAGGIALGSWAWGEVAADFGITVSLAAAGGLMFLSPLLARKLPMPQVKGKMESEVAAVSEPEVNLALTERSGPIVVEIDYRIDVEQARSFYRHMQGVQRVRQRNGAYGWSLSRDIARPQYWTERFHCPTWLDYLRQRNRATETERAAERAATAHQMEGETIRVRRLLERPFGSVRWREDSPDREQAIVATRL